MYYADTLVMLIYLLYRAYYKVRYIKTKTSIFTQLKDVSIFR